MTTQEKHHENGGWYNKFVFELLLCTKKLNLFYIYCQLILMSLEVIIITSKRGFNMQTFKVDAQSDAPIYYQLYSFLKERILNGDYRPGECVPSESEMMAEYGVSRVTVRRAIADLERDGLLKRYRGKGSVVLERKSITTLNSLYSFSEMAKRRGQPASYIILSTEVKPSDMIIAREMELPVNAPVFELKRLLLLNGRIAALTTAYVPYLDEWKDMFHDFNENTSLFDRFLEYNTIIAYAEETLEVITPSTDVRRALYLPDNLQVVYSVHKTYDDKGRIIVYTESYIASNKFKYTITIKRDE